MKWIIIHHFTCLLRRPMRQAQLHDLSVCGLLTSAPRSFVSASFFSPFRCFHPLPCAFRFAIGCGRWGCTRLLLCWLGVFAAFCAHQRWLRCLTHRRIACFCLSSVLRVWSSSVVALKLTAEPFSLRSSLFFLLSTVLTLPLPKLLLLTLRLLPTLSLLWLSS